MCSLRNKYIDNIIKFNLHKLWTVFFSKLEAGWGGGGGHGCAGRGGGCGSGSKGRGHLSLGVVRCFPDPSRPLWLCCLTPSPFPDLPRLCAIPLSLTLCRLGRRLPTSWVMHRLVHPHPGSHAGHFLGCTQACAPLPSATGVMHCIFHPSQGCPPCCLNPHCWERGGSLAEQMGACARVRLLHLQVGEVRSGAACARVGRAGGTLHPCREEGVSMTPCVVPCA